MKKQEIINNYTKNLVEQYIRKDDWRVAENATLTYSFGGLIGNNSGAVSANYWLTEVYNEDIEKAHRDAQIHIHDLGNLSPYCAGWSLRDLIQQGIVSIDGKTASSPAKHLDVLVNQMANFIGIMANEWAGAQAYSSFDTLLAPFVREDKLTYDQTKRAIESFVYGVNMPSRWAQPPFSNITLDWTVPADMKDQPVVVGGKFLDYTYGDCQKEMDMINKAFLEVMIEGDANGNGFLYPIPTYSITKDFDWSTESENNQLLFEMAAKFGTPYFSNYINSDMDPSDVRSMCPMTPDTKMLVRSSERGVRHMGVGEYYNSTQAKGTEYEVWTTEGWQKAKPVRVPMTKTYKITLSNGVEVKFGKDHLQPVRGLGTLHADQLKEGMWLPFNKEEVETNEVGSKELGFAVGAFIGDGSYDDKSLVYSLNKSSKKEVLESLEKFWNSLGFETTVSSKKDEKLAILRVKGDPRSIISKYVDGETALTKSLKRMVFNSSVSFREGVIEGFRATDGAVEKKRLYTSSPQLREDIQELFSSLGRKAMINYVDTRDGRYGKNPNFRIDYPGRKKYGQLYDEDENFIYHSITKIEEINPIGDYLYCVELDTEDKLFMLSNGLMTHNCRLRLDLRELRKNSGGGYFGSGDSTGSIGVVTINLPHISYISETEEDFFKELKRLLDISAESLHLKREFLNEQMKMGLFPYSKHYLGHFDNHFSTIGILGMNEACLNAKWLNGNIANPESKAFAEKVLDFIMEQLPDYQEQYGDLYNLEATPGESTMYRFAKHDREKFPNIITSGTETTPYYTNSSHLPVGYTEEIFTALDHQDSLQTKYSSGTVFHGFLGQRLPDWKVAMDLTRMIANEYEMPYFTFSPIYSICEEHGYINGEEHTCPTCGKPTQVFSRITGYYRAVSNWNEGKKQEFEDRKEYKIKGE